MHVVTVLRADLVILFTVLFLVPRMVCATLADKYLLNEKVYKMKGCRGRRG